MTGQQPTEDPSPEDLAAWRQQAEAELSAPLVKRATAAEAVAAFGVVRALGVWPVHRGALRGDRRRRQPWRVDRAGARRVMRLAERLALGAVSRKDIAITDRVTGEVRTVSRPTRYGGLLSAHAIKVLRTLMRYLDKQGRAYPAYETLARASGLELNTVKRACAYLRSLNIIDWTQRCAGEVRDGIYRLVQTSNEYVLVPPPNWVGYTPELEPPAPTPDTWGAPPKIEEPAAGASRDRCPELDAVLARHRAARDRGGG